MNVLDVLKLDDFSYKQDVFDYLFLDFGMQVKRSGVRCYNT